MYTLYFNAKMIITTTTICLTNKCNFNCKHCFSNSGMALKDELKLEEIRNILSQLKILKVKRIELTGGECFLRKDLFEIIRYAKRLNFEVKILTNGSLLTQEIIKKLEKEEVDGIAISIEGLDYEIFKKIRPTSKKVFNNILKNIKLATKSNLFTKINMVIMKDNMQEVQKIINFCDKNKIDELRICFFTRIGRGKKLDQCVNNSKWMNFAKSLNRKYTKVYVGFSHAPINGDCLLKENIPLTIWSNGDVSLCPLLKPVGNIRENRINKILIDKMKIKFCTKDKKDDQICPLRKFDISSL
jgi:MoaA/NifB/PqqE/SkfB family radical SAM enzyme